MLDDGDRRDRVECLVSKWKGVVEIGVLDGDTVQTAQPRLARILGTPDNRLRHIQSVNLAEFRSARKRDKATVATAQIQQSLTRLKQFECRWNPMKLEAA